MLGARALLAAAAGPARGASGVLRMLMSCVNEMMTCPSRPVLSTADDFASKGRGISANCRMGPPCEVKPSSLALYVTSDALSGLRARSVVLGR